MWMSIIFYLPLVVGGVVGWGKDLKVTQEKITIDYSDKKYVDVAVEIYKLNHTINALNGTATFKFEFQNNVKYYAAIFKEVNNEYTLNVFHMEQYVKAFTSMEAFGVADLCLKHTKPPATWPLKKGVAYHTEGWSPDSSKFPPKLPDGNWKLKGKLFFVNKTKIIELSWYLKIAYE